MTNADPAILFVKPKALKTADKRALKETGVIVVEVDNPNEVKFLRAHTELSGPQLLACAAKAIADVKDGEYGSHVKKAFAAEICAALVRNA